MTDDERGQILQVKGNLDALSHGKYCNRNYMFLLKPGAKEPRCTCYMQRTYEILDKLLGGTEALVE